MIPFIDSLAFRCILICAVFLLYCSQLVYEERAYRKCNLIDDAEAYKKEAEAIKDSAEKIKKEYDVKVNSAKEKAELIIQKAQREYDLKTETANELVKTIIENCKKEIMVISDEANKKAMKLDEEISKLQKEYNKINNEYTYEISKFTIDDNITSEEYKSKYNMSVLKEKDMIKAGEAVTKVLSDNSEMKKQIENDAKQLLRCFNSEMAAILLAINVKNIDSSKNKIIRAYETLNKLFTADMVSLSKDFLEIKLEQADLMYAYQYQKEQERLQQKAIREQMVEEEKVRREIEKEKAKIEKEEKQFRNEITKLMGYMQKSDDVEKQLYIDKIHELEEKLKKIEADKENVLEREQNTRAGYVYVISNIGSFGDDVYKIGMTRRLEPMDRVKELGDASVPFEFDVHAMIFSEDAPALETILHNAFKNNQINKVNPRKEFFKVKLDEIEKVVKGNYNATVTFTKIAEAAQYRESLRLAEMAAI